MWKKAAILVITLLIVLQVVGCGSSQTTNGDNTKDSTENVTLQVFVSNAYTDAEFSKFFTDPIKKKFPNVTLELVRPSSTISLDSLVASGTLPDLLLSSNTGIYRYVQMDVMEDLNPYIKKNNLDMSRFDPVPIQALKGFSDKGEMIGLPIDMNFSALFYNKDIFDKFGVPYPKDGMNWDDAIQLARGLTKSDGGVQYRGLNPAGADLMGYGLSLPFVDPKTNQAALNTDQWRMVVNKAVSIYEMPGWMEGTLPGGQGQDNFLKDRTTAMLGAWGNTMLGPLEQMQKDGKGMNWDMVTIPNFSEASGYGREVDFDSLFLSKNSKHKDLAFQVMSYIASSNEVQTIIDKSGRLPAIQKTPEMQKNFATDLEIIKGKNLNAIFGVKPSKLHSPYTPYDGNARGLLNAAAYDVARGKYDVNTALRNADDQENQYIKDHSN